jgi:hypothetical protein
MGTPFKVNREYAQRFGDSWVALSAKYGFLWLDDPISGPYNVTFKRRGRHRSQSTSSGATSWNGTSTASPVSLL